MSTLKLMLISSIIFAGMAVFAPPIHTPTGDGSDWTSKHEAEMRRRCPPITPKELKSVVSSVGSSNNLPRR